MSMLQVQPDDDDLATLYLIVRKLWRDGGRALSRNKNYEAYDDPFVRRAWRLARHLSSIERDLERVHAAQRAQSSTQDYICVHTIIPGSHGQARIVLSIYEQGRRRTSILSPYGWWILLENERVACILLPLMINAQQDPTLHQLGLLVQEASQQLPAKG